MTVGKLNMTMVILALLALAVCANDPEASPPPSTPPDKLKKFFHELNDDVNFLVKPILTSFEILWVSIFLVLQWHIRYFFADAYWVELLNKYIGQPTRISRRLGLNVWILQFYYDPDIPKFIQSRAFVASCWLVFFDQVLLFYFMQWISGKERSKSADENYIVLNERREVESWSDPRWDEEDETEGDADDPVTSKYGDLTYPFRRLVPMFIIQGALLLLYVDNLNSDADTKQLENVKFSYWIIGVLLQLYAGDRQLGDSYRKKFWDKFNDPEYSDMREASHEVCLVGHVKYRWEWDMRQFMDFTINSVCRLIIMFTFPIMLCVEEPLDFVKDCTAVFFMTTLDDLEPDDYKTIPQMMVRLKFNLLYEKIRDDPSNCENGLPDPPVLLSRDEARVAQAPKRGDVDLFTRQRQYHLKRAGVPDSETFLMEHLLAKQKQTQDTPYM